MKILLVTLKARLDLAEHRISEMKGTIKEITQRHTEKKRDQKKGRG